MKLFLRAIFITIDFWARASYKVVVMPIKKSMFSKCGKNVYLGKKSSITYKNTFVGNNVSIGNNAIFMSTIAKIFIGNNVMFGPRVTIITGDHRLDVIGEYMINVHEKLIDNDLDVIIEDDVWIGANTTILKGVVIGKGSVIAAGSIVVKDVEEYSIYAGAPAKKVKSRFTQEELEEHKIIINNK